VIDRRRVATERNGVRDARRRSANLTAILIWSEKDHSGIATAHDSKPISTSTNDE
jgi:hypothetical protein